MRKEQINAIQAALQNTLIEYLNTRISKTNVSFFEANLDSFKKIRVSEIRFIRDNLNLTEYIPPQRSLSRLCKSNSWRY